MNLVLAVCQWLYDLPPAAALRESETAYPIVETVHVLAVTLVVGTILFVDLRVLGVLLRGERASDVIDRLVRLTWIGFAVMAASGLLLFAAEAAKLYGNIAFETKLGLLALAGANQAVFHATSYRTIGAWEIGRAPLAARTSALSSLLLWTGVITCGRLIAYLHVH